MVWREEKAVSNKQEEKKLAMAHTKRRGHECRPCFEVGETTTCRSHAMPRSGFTFTIGENGTGQHAILELTAAGNHNGDYYCTASKNDAQLTLHYRLTLSGSRAEVDARWQ